MGVDYQALGKRVRACRKGKDITQEELAQRVGISTSFLGHVERGTRVLSVETLVKLCEVLHITPNRLLGFEEARPAAEVPYNLQAFGQDLLQAALQIAERHFCSERK